MNTAAYRRVTWHPGQSYDNKHMETWTPVLGISRVASDNEGQMSLDISLASVELQVTMRDRGVWRQMLESVELQVTMRDR